MMGKGMGSAAALATGVMAVSCSCRALGFVTPTVVGGAVARAGERTRNVGLLTVSTAKATTRPRALPQLFSSKEPTPGGTDFVDSLAMGAKEMTVEEKVAALQREVQSQVTVADEEEANMTPEEIEAVDEEDKQIEKDGFKTSVDFVDEGKNILWPNPRRVIQLTVLAVAAQIAFIVYIISLNAFLNSVPIWFGKLVDAYKAGSIRLPDL